MAHTNHICPFYLSMTTTEFLGKVVSRFTYNLYVLYHCIEQHAVRTKIIKTLCLNKSFNMFDGTHDMLQPTPVSNRLSHILNVCLD